MQETPAALFFDVDGTLVWHDPSIDVSENIASGVPSPAVADAFRRLRERGHLAFICTGRPMCLVQEPLLALEPAGIVTSAGSCLFMEGKPVFERVIEREVLERTAELLCSLGVPVLLEGSKGCVAFMASEEEARKFPHTVPAMSVEELHERSDMRFSKFSFDNRDLPRLASARAFLDKHFACCDLGLGTSEMTPLGIDKGAGVRNTLAHLGLEGARTFAFGDSENDLAMLSAVEVPVAMGNAMPAVKDVAAHVTAAVQDDGVPAALVHFGLI